MPKPQAIARNSDRNPNLGGSPMKKGHKLPKTDKTTAYHYRMGPKCFLKNTIRDKNLSRMKKAGDMNY